jgi:regulator of nucleoside diphosphate kinase
MKYDHLILEKKEYVCIKRVLNLSGFNLDQANKESLSKLSEELITAQVLDEEDMPLDVIRLNSKVRISTKNGWEEEVQVVIPNHGDLSKKKISILKPMGAALIGYAQGDVVTWQFPMGIQELHIVSVEQDMTSNKLQSII